MIKVLFQVFYCLSTGVCTGVCAFLKILPIYERLSGIWEDIIVAAIGVPAILVSLFFLIPKAIKFLSKL